MGCAMCEYTGIAHEYDETAGPSFVEVPCPECHGVDGDEPVWVTDINDAATQSEIDEAWRRHAEEERWTAYHS